ncbi:MAG: hypothetical protein LKJ88_04255 [Bacilli bacterium]|jgi:hypothetical protein|nr:hypothetical protein [Bacilli bacterium]
MNVNRITKLNGRDLDLYIQGIRDTNADISSTIRERKKRGFPLVKTDRVWGIDDYCRSMAGDLRKDRSPYSAGSRKAYEHYAKNKKFIRLYWK